MKKRKPFNSPLLGFFLDSVLFPDLVECLVGYFQFPFAGIFPWLGNNQSGGKFAFHLSIPLCWDFSLTQVKHAPAAAAIQLSFNSPLLGFFLDSSSLDRSVNSRLMSFNSPLLGFFLDSLPVASRVRRAGATFNSPLLGFFLDSDPFSAVFHSFRLAA